MPLQTKQLIFSRLYRTFLSAFRPIMASAKPNLDNSISFEPKKMEKIPSIDKMIREIIDSKNIYEKLESNPAMAEKIDSVRQRFKEEYAMVNTDRPRDINNLQTRNLIEFLDYIETSYTSDEQSDVSLTEKIVKEGHEIILKQVTLPEKYTKPGQLSDLRKCTTYKGEEYWYQYFPEGSDGMSRKFSLIIGHFKSLYNSLAKNFEQEEKQLCIFKSCAWFLFEVLDLHPFCDANGRLFRAICSFFLSYPFGPFPCPIYKACREDPDENHSFCNKPCKDDYEQALVDARTIEPDRHPRQLCTMMIYCCWDSWKQFLKELEKSKSDE